MTKQPVSPYLGLLDALKMTKTELAVELGIHQRSVYRWKDDPPNYVVAYLKLRLKASAMEKDLAVLRAAFKVMERKEP